MPVPTCIELFKSAVKENRLLAFVVVAPTWCNSLPEKIRRAATLLSFCKICKTVLFKRAFKKEIRIVVESSAQEDIFIMEQDSSLLQ